MSATTMRIGHANQVTETPSSCASCAPYDARGSLGNALAAAQGASTTWTPIRAAGATRSRVV